MSQAADDLADALEETHQQLVTGGVDHQWPPPPAPGWAHLPVIVIDLVFNLSRDYDKVARPAIRGYTDYASRKLDWVDGPETLRTAYADVVRPGHWAHMLNEALKILSR